MITKEQALKIANDFIYEPDDNWPEKPEMLIVDSEERNFGWLFYWTSKRYLETKQTTDSLAGNGPILVSRESGKLETTRTAPPLEDRIAEAERRLNGKNLTI